MVPSFHVKVWETMISFSNRHISGEETKMDPIIPTALEIFTEL